MRNETENAKGETEMEYTVFSGDGEAIDDVDATSEAAAIEMVNASWDGGAPADFLPLSARPAEPEETQSRVTDEVLTAMAAAIRERHPSVRVRTAWSDFDMPTRGIEIHERHATTGNTLAASISDTSLAAMTIIDVCER